MGGVEEIDLTGQADTELNFKGQLPVVYE